jgi:transcription antitermination factor NusG
MLENKGHKTFLPLYMKQHRYVRRVREFQLPLFPGYVFCRFDVQNRMPVLVTPGVIQILGSGRTPIPVEESEISALQRAVDSRLSIQPHPFLQTRDKVRITEGPLAGIEGVVMRTEHPLRIVLSVTLLKRSVLVEVDAASLLPDINKSERESTYVS